MQLNVLCKKQQQQKNRSLVKIGINSYDDSLKLERHKRSHLRIKVRSLPAILICLHQVCEDIIGDWLLI